MPGKRTRATQQQLAALAAVKTYLGERGYFLSRLRRHHCRSRYDIVVSERGGTAFLIVRLMPDHSISFRPFAAKNLHGRIRDLIPQWRKKVPARLHWRSRPLIFMPRKRANWKKLFTKKGLEDMRLLQIGFMH